MKIVWANEVFFKLAKKFQPELASRDELIGQTTKALWKLDDYHPIVLNDESVKATNKASYFNEQLPSSRFRTSLRFPIPGKDGEARFICAISTHLKDKGFSDTENRAGRADSSAEPTRAKGKPTR